MKTGYGFVLRHPGAPLFFASAAAGRVGIAMTSLSIVWVVHSASGSFLIAGSVTGVFALAEAFVGPLVARLVDRYGQPRVVPGQVAVHLLFSCTFLWIVVQKQSDLLMYLLAALMGSSIPQFGALSAARWSHVLRRASGNELESAFSLESIANGMAFLVGPAVVSLLGANSLSAVSLLGASSLILFGGVALALQKRTAPTVGWTRSLRRASEHSLALAGWSTSLTMLVLMNLAMGIYFGSIQVSVTGFALGTGVENLAAVVFLVGSCSGLIGAFVYGRLGLRSRLPNRLAVIATVFGALVSLLLLIDNIYALLIVVLVTEILVPPILVNLNVLMEKSAPSNILTEAFTWANSSSAAGAALATSLAGLLLDSWGSSGGFYVVVSGAALLSLLALGARRRLNRRSSPPLQRSLA